jgi:uncharacterized protein (TIGR03086 family)
VRGVRRARAGEPPAFWAPRLEAAARTREAPPIEAGERDVDLTGGDWSAAVAGQVRGLFDAYAQPGAFEGATSMGGAALPASLIAEMVLAEWVVHGWDVARATGQELPCTGDLASAVFAVARSMAPQGWELAS